MKSVGNIFPVPHVALIYQDGSVFDLSLHEDLSPSQGKLLKLPKDEGYFGYSDPQGVLYLISATIYRKITKYHRSFNHRTIQDSGARGYIDGYWEFWDDLNDLSSSYYFKYGIQFGRKFWAMDHLMKGSNSPHPTSSIRSCDVTKNSFQWDIGDDIWTEASSITLIWSWNSAPKKFPDKSLLAYHCTHQKLSNEPNFKLFPYGPFEIAILYVLLYYIKSY